MELIIKPFHAYPCELEIFTINGKAADCEDFGDTIDYNEKERKHYSCGNVQFKSKLPTSEVLQRYNITIDEYNTICAKLEDELSVGECSWCFKRLIRK